MIHNRKPEEVRRFDMFKLIITILLTALLLCMIAFNPFQTSEPVSSPPIEAAITPDSAPSAVELRLNEPTNGKALPSGEVTFMGTGTPYQVIQVLVDDEVVGKTEIASDGTWQFSTSLETPGEYEVKVEALDVENNVLESSAATILVVGDVEAPTVNLPSDGSTSAGEITLTGTGTPGEEVEIVVDGEVVGTAEVASDGTWQLSTELAEAGEVEVSVQTVDADGAIVAQSESALLSIRDEAGEETASEQTTVIICERDYIVLVNDSLIQLASRFWADWSLYPAIVTATNQKYAEDNTFANITNPNFIRPGWKLCLVDVITARKLVD